MKIAALAVTAALCAMVLKKSVPELALVLVLAGGGLILACLANALDEVKAGVQEMLELSGLDGTLMLPVVKGALIAWLTKITAEFCRDAKEGGLASFVELAGAVLALTIALPLMWTVFREIGRLL